MPERPPEIRRQISSGGVIFRDEGKGVEAAIILVRGKNAWCLPKGLIDEGEEPPVTAKREVREETGLSGEILDKIGQTSYWYFLKQKTVKVHKTVHFYLLKYIDGNTDDHDHEVDEAVWLPLNEAVDKLSYKSESEILQRAGRMIQKSGQ